MSQIKVVAVSGNPGTPSRTVSLVQRVLDTLAERAHVETHLVEIADVGPRLGQALTRKALSPAAEATVALVESAQLLVVGSPTYRATYTGQFKHLFDLVGYEALVGTPVILTATGGSDRHALLIEHQLRPLFSFFRAFTVPTGIYAVESDFEDYQVKAPEVTQRVDAAVDEALRFFPHAVRASEKLRAIA